MIDKRDAIAKLDTVVFLAEQVIDKARAAQTAIAEVSDEPPERTKE